MREIPIHETWIGRLYNGYCPCFPKIKKPVVRPSCPRRFYCQMADIQQIFLNPNKPTGVQFAIALLKTGLFTGKNIMSIAYETLPISLGFSKDLISAAKKRIKKDPEYQTYELLKGSKSKILYLRNTDTRKRQGKQIRRCSLCHSPFHNKKRCEKRIWKYTCEKKNT